MVKRGQEKHTASGGKVSGNDKTDFKREEEDGGEDYVEELELHDCDLDLECRVRLLVERGGDLRQELKR